MSATDGKSDAAFWQEFGVILGLLFLFFIAMIILARAVGGAALDRIANAEGDVLARIAPVAEVRVGDPTKTTEAPAAPAASGGESSGVTVVAAAKSGEDVYNTACLACHATGVANAPKLGDKAAWDPRLGQGLAGLITSVIKGKGAMPAKGGNASLSDADVEAAVKFMLEKTGVSAGG